MEPRPDKNISGPSMIPTMNISKRVGTGAWDIQSGSAAYHASSDASLFSSSLPVLHHDELMVNDRDQGHQSIDDSAALLDKIHQDIEDSLEDVAKQTVGFVLPDNEDELFSDIVYGHVPPQLEELEDSDIFDNLGGMELETDGQDSLSMGMAMLNLTDSVAGSGMITYGQPNGVGTVVGEHPYGEHPSRTLFVRNINSNVEDSELKSLFEEYGDIRTLYTACKHRGFVMISYYDIRHARTAMRALQNKPLRRRKLDIHFSIPKDNPSEKDINQGTLVIFNLDPSVSNEDLLQIFGAYGEVKEIRETPNKRHHKFIEFFDVRAAEAALKALNRSDIAGKRIKLEPSRPGGTRRSWMLQLNPELEPDESQRLRHHVGSPLAGSPSGNWAQQFNGPIEHSPIHSFSRSPGFRTMSPTTSSLSGLSSLLQSHLSNSMKSNGDVNSERQSNFEHPHSFPELNLGQYSSNMSFAGSTSNGSSDIETLSGPQFLWGSPNKYPEKPKTAAWTNPSGGHVLASNGHGHGFPFATRKPSPFIGSSQHHNHHVGSAPSGVYLERQFGFFPESPDASMLNAPFGGGMNIGPNSVNYMMNVGPRAAIHGGIGGNISDNGSPSFRMMSSPRPSPVFLGNGPYPGLGINGGDMSSRSRRVENSYQTENKKQFQLDLEKIANAEDSRTTLMIKNIPNKYTSKMLLAAIDETHKGTYDFLYLPIDFKNKCNVGYAFINMLSPSHIISFYQAFNGKKWEKFNSEKVASLAYARIQGRAALIAHFQNSSVMNEDKRCRPILFTSEGGDAGEQIILEPLPSTNVYNQTSPPNGSAEPGDLSVGPANGGRTEDQFERL